MHMHAQSGLDKQLLSSVGINVLLMVQLVP